MGDLINLIVDLDEVDDAADARERVERAGLRIDITSGAPGRVLAWIDEVFGGAWSSEAALSTNVIAMRADVPVGFASVAAQGLRFAWLRKIAREPGVGIFGPFGVAPEERGGVIGPALLKMAMHELRAQGYRRALIAATNDALAPYYERHTGARIVERYDPRSFTPVPVRTLVLASGSGTNFQAVADRVANGLPLELIGLVSNRAQAFALERARNANVPAIALPWKRAEQSREEYDRTLLQTVSDAKPELVLLLGWMHLLPPQFVQAFPSMLNVHPAYLPLEPERDDVVVPDGTTIPAFRGPRAVADAIAAGSAWVGASVHAVTTQTDRGAILVRKPMPVHAGETESDVLERLHPIEHQVVASAVYRWLFERS